MRVSLFLSVLVTLASWTVHAEPISDLSGGQTGRIEFRTTTPAQRWAMVNRNTSQDVSAVVWGDLLMPKSPSTKVPAVIISHGSEGASSLYYDVWAKALNEAGYAVFIVDSFKPRDVARNLGAQQMTWNITANISDALHALKLLSTHPGIRHDRIFHMGFSKGGTAALEAAWPLFQRTILPAGMRWAGTVSTYPQCTIRYRADHAGRLPAPMMLVLGERDDHNPAKHCMEYAESLASKGQPVTYKVYAGAYHVFDRLDQPYRKVRDGSVEDCRLEIYMPETPGDNFAGARNYKTGERIANGNEWGKAIERCSTTVTLTVESNPAARAAAVRDVVEFLNSAP